ncbi:RNA-guided endonuclease InsQ/TnpB family protein [Glycomyces dulcitolivorans]|uniref:RNA-guided endonuclease InsQ/TnpB family protein n=1 Tax=Glycomyces dulcitolivorans TaxID=2200759 RepID=UPI0018E51870|nr:RNA-guided endonuclease TnpB family protein [Glycomyces dulcitolivorans]
MGKLETRKARFRYRLRLSGSALEVLTAEWDRCRWVWNECVATALAAYQAGEECGPARLDRKLTGWRAAHEWLRDGSSVAQQQAVRSFGIARAAALKDIKNRVPIGRRHGLPRFKCKSRVRPSLNYTRRGFRLKDDRLLLAGGIALTVVWSRPLPQEPSSVRIYQDSLGHWYASFVIPGSAEPLPATGRAVGIDWGVKVLATASADGHDLSHPAHGKRIEAEVARRRRSMARRRPDSGDGCSKGYLAARHLMAKAYKKAARQRQETARKWAKRLVREFDQIAVEDFRPKFMFKSTMARKASDAAIAATKRELIAMARKHGRDLQLVNPAHTTTDCAQCGARTKTALPLSERTYSCGSCGHRGPRDKNSAMVMLVRAGFNPTGVESTRPDRSPVDQAA